MRRRKRIKRWLVYAAARLVAAIWSLLPLSAALALGRGVGLVAYALDVSDRRRAIAQLQEALSLSAGDARRVAKEMFRHLGMIVAEVVLLPRLRDRLASYVELPAEGLELLRRLIEQKRGVILISAHLGNWELLAQRIVAEGIDGTTIARDNPNPYLGRWLVARRGEGNVPSIDRNDPGGAHKILAALKRGAVLGFLIDQDTRVPSTFVPFFGRPASTPLAPAQLALRRDIPVVAGFIYRRKEGGHVIHLEEVSLAALEAEGKDARINAATARMTAAIERAVRRAPEQWVWFHRRWKTKAPVTLERSP